MRTSCFVIVSLLALGGCATEPDSSTTVADASDPVCTATAAARSRDAAVNGYDQEAQRNIWQDAYKSCVVWKTKSTLVESGRR
ncbi:MAG: hypothetical protein P4L57_02720 [Rhizomicrobium sp.]|nr:hypothetical protein [Rhizomicrobium sp.]